MYIAVSSTSTDAASGGAFQANPKGAGDVLITKIDSGGIQAFQTYLGGAALDTVAGIAVDSGFNIVVSGTTSSSDFPTLNGAQSGPASAGTQHAFVTSLNPAGNALVYSTYIRGSGTDIAQGLAVDVKNKAYVIGTTTSTDLPTTDEAFQKSSLSTNQFFVAMIDPLATGAASVPYLTYFGGGNPNNGIVTGGGIAVDANSNVYITGGTNFVNTGTSAATDFPILNGFENCLNAPSKPATCTIGSTQTDAFVAKLNPTAAVGDQLQYSLISVVLETMWLMGLRSTVAPMLTSLAVPIQLTCRQPGLALSIGECYRCKRLPGETQQLHSIDNFHNYDHGHRAVLHLSGWGSSADRGLAVAVDSAQGARIDRQYDSR